MEQGALPITISNGGSVTTHALQWYRYNDGCVCWSIPHLLDALYPDRAAKKTLKHLWGEISFAALQSLERAGHDKSGLEEPSKRMLGYNADAFTCRTREEHTCATRLLVHTCMANLQGRVKKTHVRFGCFITAFLRALAVDALLQEDIPARVIVFRGLLSVTASTPMSPHPPPNKRMFKH
eukprot:2499183-Amphidinium_carterae.1